MTEAWNGRPPAPLDEVDGRHWLRSSCGDLPCEWLHEYGHWRAWSERNSAAVMVAFGWQYIGPALTPEQIEAKIAEAVKAEREDNARLRKALSEVASAVGGFASVECSTDFMCLIPGEVRLKFAEAIRARGDAP